MQQYKSKTVLRTEIKVATMKIFSFMNGNHHVPTTKLTLFAVRKHILNRIGYKGGHCMHSDMAKGTSRAEAMLNSEKIKPIA